MLKVIMVLGLVLGSSASVFAADVPGGLNRTSDALPEYTYELMLSPSYTFSPSGAYMSSEIRFQPNQDFGAGLGFGAGEVGYNFGINGTFYLLPDSSQQPAVSIMGGLYFNRVQPHNYLVMRVTPAVSKTIAVTWGTVTPYAGLHLSPSFRMTESASNDFGTRIAAGARYTVKDWDGLNIFTEMNLNLVHSISELNVGLSYPFAAL